MFWVHRIPTQSIAITWVTRFTWALHPSPDVVTDGLDLWKFAFLRNCWPFSGSLPIAREIIIALWFNEDKARKKFWTKVMFFAIDVIFISLLGGCCRYPYHWDATCQVWAPDSTASQLTRRYQCTVCSQFAVHDGRSISIALDPPVLHVPGTLRFHILLLTAAFVASYCNSQPFEGPKNKSNTFLVWRLISW